jgi:actin-related protein 10
LKTGGVEVPREKWDEYQAFMEDESRDASLDGKAFPSRGILPDWTRNPLPVGAPSAKAPIPPSTPVA